MKNTIKILLASAIFAAVLSAAGCAQPTTGQNTAVSDTVISQSDTVSTEQPDTEELPMADELPQKPDVELNLPEDFYTGTITETRTVLEAGDVLLTIDPNVYVPEYTEEYTKILIDALETASGLSYSDAKYNSNPVNIHVTKAGTDAGSGTRAECEVASAWASSGTSRTLDISSGDLFLGNSGALAHELSHTLSYSHSQKTFNTVATEGFAEYNAYKALTLLERNAPHVAYSLDMSCSCILDMDIPDPSTVYTNSIEYWMEKDFPFEYSGNGSYSLGFRFMAYLDDVYGNYSKWLTISDELEYNGIDTPMEIQLNSFRLAYGEDVFDGFYPWLKKNESRFIVDYFTVENYDMRGVNFIEIYPFFMYHDCATMLVNHMPAHVKYDDLYIDLEEARKYLSEYKLREIDNLVLEIEWVEGDKAIELFDKSGKSLGVLTNETLIPLDNVSYVLLKGEGSVGNFSISGYKTYSDVIN